MTLMPVNNTSLLVFRSSNFGGSRCIGKAPVRSNSFMPSITCPVTFIKRPFTWSPTGMVIGAPCEMASIPLLNPSVLSIATVRTVFSPMCCCTSTTRIFPFGRVISIASWIRGRTIVCPSCLSSKWISTTGPITCEI